ncbi:hypothetical protein LN650_13165 [Klebsiella pneumoniae subsp. pneumoniae]|nr:hypothetical protein [Klebsiella pneumoniae subsp. pneumoniae]
MMKVDAAKRGTWDRQIPIAVRSSWRGAMECNGNGLCFNFDVKSPMCPSMKVQQPAHPLAERAGDAGAEWLRLLADRGVDPNQLEKALPEQGVSLRRLVARTRNSCGMRAKANMTSRMRSKRRCPAVWPCKACSTQCPIKIDVPGVLAALPAAVPQPLSAAGARSSGGLGRILCAADGAGAEDL